MCYTVIPSKKTNDEIPSYLAQYADKFVKTCHANLHSARMSICEGKALVATTQKPYFQVQSTDGSVIYDIHIDKPSCSCLYFKKQFLPCKHIFILLEVGHIHWEDLPHSYI